MMATDLFEKFGVDPRTQTAREPRDLFAGMNVAPNPPVDPYANPDLGGTFWVDMGRGFLDVAQGGKQLALLLGEKLNLVDEGATDQYTRDIAGEINAYEQDRGALNAGRFAGNLLSMAAIPGGVAGNAATRMGTAALSGGVAGSMMPVTDEDIAAAKGRNLLMGGVGGAAGSAALSGAGKAYNAVRGRYASESAQEVVDTANHLKSALRNGSEAPDMPLSVGDIRGGAIIPKTETHLENIPLVGFSGLRETQNRTARDWATRLIDKIDNGTVNVGETIQHSAQTKFDYLRDVARGAFTEIGQEADRFGAVPLGQFQQAAQRHADQLKRLVDANPGFESLFGPKLEKLNTFANNTELNYSDLRLLRDELSDMADGFMPNSEVIGKRGANVFIDLRQAMERDITEFMRQIGGGLESKYLKAKRFYEKRVVPYKGESKTGLNLLLKDQEPDKLLKKWVHGDKADKAKRLWTALNRDGREAVKIGILRDAFENATRGQASEFGVFSHAGFANTLDKYRQAIPQFFTRDEEVLIRGYQKILRHTARAGQYMENPSTGARNALPMMIGGGVIAGTMASPLVTAKLAGGALGLRWLFGSKSGRALLLSASDIDVESDAMKAIVRQISRQVPRTSAVASGAEHEGHSRNLLVDPAREPQ